MSTALKNEGLRQCPACAEDIKTAAKKCKHCGEILDASLTLVKGNAQGVGSGAAAVASFFIPGLGQFFQGHIVAGIAWLIFTAAGYSLMVLPGLIIHIACVMNAYSSGGGGDGDPTNPKSISGGIDPDSGF